MAEEGEFDKGYLTMATLFLFGGAAGKSAQFPFHVWLPDAMQGPTPVSALIHAATMVVAGVYLVARVMPLFEASYDGALYVVVAVGLITTFLSVFMGLVMTDIKQVVAYSTLNSLGLMMVALGFGEAGVGPAMLYLFCHAFFKALLFLGCGSVIHSTGSQEIPELGGLTGRMPITSRTSLRLLRQG
jgi:NADH-quinone oxidoreductase subunit L